MATVYALKRESGRANPQQIPETDAVDIAALLRQTAGLGDLYGAADTVTTSVNLGTGSAVTGVTVGGGAAYTGSTFGKASVLDTFLGNLQIDGSLSVNGTATVIDISSIRTQDALITMGVTTRATAGQNLALAFYGGSNANVDALLYWNQGASRFDFGYSNTGATGSTFPPAPTTWVDAKLNNLTLAGTTITGVGASTTLTTDSHNLTVSTTTSGTLAVTSAGALNLTGAAASLFQTTAGALTITSAAAATWSTTAGLLNVTGAGGLTLTASGANNISFNAHGGTVYTFNDASNLALNAGFAGVTSVIGALNYLYLNPSPNGVVSYTNGNAGTITQGQSVYITTSPDTVDLTNVATNTLACNLIGVVAPAAGIATTVTGGIQVAGVALVRFNAARHVPAVGDPVLLDDAHNGYAVSFNADPGAQPNASNHVLVELGFVKDLNGNTAGSLPGIDFLVNVEIQPQKSKLVL